MIAFCDFFGPFDAVPACEDGVEDEEDDSGGEGCRGRDFDFFGEVRLEVYFFELLEGDFFCRQRRVRFRLF